MKKMIGSKQRNLLMVGLFCISAVSVAQDNPTPVSWGNITVTATETYGNNQSRLIRGAKAIIELKDKNKANNSPMASRIPRFPQTKTMGSRGANFSKMPPSSMVGQYIIKVIPQNKNCSPKTKEVNHSNRSNRVKFHFTCFGANTQNNANKVVDANACHTVRIQSQGSYARAHKPVKVEACPNKQGLWEIKPFRY